MSEPHSSQPCAKCGEGASGVYRYQIPGQGEFEEPLCRGCASRYRSLKVTEIERVDDMAPE